MDYVIIFCPLYVIHEHVQQKHLVIFLFQHYGLLFNLAY